MVNGICKGCEITGLTAASRLTAKTWSDAYKSVRPIATYLIKSLKVITQRH